MNRPKNLSQAREIQVILARILVAYGIITAALPSSLMAATLHLPEEIYPYRIVEQDVAVVLREFGENLGIHVQPSPNVSGVVKEKIPPLRALDFLNQICQMHGLEWYFDGSTLYISSVTEGSTKSIQLSKPVSRETLIEALKQLSFYDERYPIRQGANSASVFVSGPPAYLGLVEQTLASIHGGSENLTETKIYRGGSVSVETFSSVQRQ